jgi:hypothetical protein
MNGGLRWSCRACEFPNDSAWRTDSNSSRERAIFFAARELDCATVAGCSNYSDFDAEFSQGLIIFQNGTATAAPNMGAVRYIHNRHSTTRA